MFWNISDLLVLHFNFRSAFEKVATMSDRETIMTFFFLMNIYEVCPEGIQLCNMKKTLIEEDARYEKHCT